MAAILIFSALGIFGFQCWAKPFLRPLVTKEVSIEKLSKNVQQIVAGANKQVGKTLIYDPSYENLKYPGGDVPLYKGVCTDVVIRALREIKVDLQKKIHEDMKKHFPLYPKNWGLKFPDKNIDHRRVPNQQKFFERQGWSLPITTKAKDYRPGDIVAWKLLNGRDHVGVVTNKVTNNGTPLVVHNIGWGARIEDVLFDWTITGHYRYPEDKISIKSGSQSRPEAF